MHLFFASYSVVWPRQHVVEEAINDLVPSIRLIYPSLYELSS